MDTLGAEVARMVAAWRRSARRRRTFHGSLRSVADAHDRLGTAAGEAAIAVGEWSAAYQRAEGGRDG
jgi:hypothetical protein